MHHLATTQGLLAYVMKLFSFMQAWRYSQDLAIHLDDEFAKQQ